MARKVLPHPTPRRRCATVGCVSWTLNIYCGPTPPWLLGSWRIAPPRLPLASNDEPKLVGLACQRGGRYGGDYRDDSSEHKGGWTTQGGEIYLPRVGSHDPATRHVPYPSGADVWGSTRVGPVEDCLDRAVNLLSAKPNSVP